MLPLPPPRRAPLLSTSPSGLVAASTCGRVVHIVPADDLSRLLCAYRLPARARLLAWEAVAEEGSPALVAIAADGHAYRLVVRAAEGRKRPRDNARPRPRPVSAHESIANLGRSTAYAALLFSSRSAAPLSPPLASSLVFSWDDTGEAQLVQLPGEAGQQHGALSLCPALDAPCGTSVTPPRLLELRRATTAVTNGVKPLCGPSSVELEPALYRALHGGGASATCLLFADADETGEVRTAALDELVYGDAAMPDAAAVPLAALGEPAVALLAAAPSPATQPPPADTLVALGARGAVLVLTTHTDGSLRRQPWRLPSCAVLSGCVVDRTLIVLTSTGAHAHELPAVGATAPSVGVEALAATTDDSAAAAAAAESAARLAALATSSHAWSAPSSRSTPDSAAPELPTTPLPIAPLPLAAAALPSGGGTSAGGATAASPALCVIDSAGALRRVALTEAASSDAAANVGEEAECFVSGHTERCLRERLRLIGEGASLLSTHQAALARAERRLAERVAAHGAIRALSSRETPLTAGGGPCTVSVSDDGRELHMSVQNATAHALGEGWCLMATVTREAPLGGCGDDGASLSSESRCMTLAGLPAASRWQLALPLPDGAWRGPLRVLAFVCYRASSSSRLEGGGAIEEETEAEAPPTACAMVHVHEVLLHQLLRQRARWPPPSNAGSESGALAINSKAEAGALASEAGSSGGGEMATATTHYKLRLVPFGGGNAPTRSATDCLRSLLAASAYQAADGDGGKGGSGQRQANASLELPDGTHCSLRVSAGGESSSGQSNSAIQLIMQCDEPASLWALRSALLQKLTRSKPLETPIAPPPTAAPAADAPETSRTHALADEAASLLPLLRRWQLAHVQLDEQVHRCFELRRRFDRGSASVSLRELAIEVAHQCKRSLDLHQAIRVQAGCPALDTGA